MNKTIKRRKSIKHQKTQKLMTCSTYIKSKRFNVYLNKLWNNRLKHWINVEPGELKKYKSMYKIIFIYIVGYACEHNLGCFAKGHPQNPITTKYDLPIPYTKPSDSMIHKIIKSNTKHVISILSGIY